MTDWEAAVRGKRSPLLVRAAYYALRPALTLYAQRALTPDGLISLRPDALTSATRHAETLVESFTGLGKVPAPTLRQRVAALNGSGAGNSGRFGS